MATKIERVTILYNGKTKVIPKSAFPMAEKHFGAVLLEAQSIEPPYELKSIPVMQKPKPLKIEPPVFKAPVPEVPEVKKDEPEVVKKVIAKTKRKAPVKSKAK